ncbi:hypothetical protein GBC03_18220 [Citrobacter telavivensis]|uniref:Uncharacterized protein n=1 Tax=Citrobacter telavivensis TaxID=2653932 RepID=A0A6L5EDQ0_9ENTR|nr:hypothetical protein [Citrobacter telavivensis]QFS72009.1 hypothetical protein GBC03_18220 [Citrobacter telavivensis]
MTPALRDEARGLTKSQKHDINHKKREVNKNTKDFCRFDNNMAGGSREQALPRGKSMQCRCQTASND